MLIELVESGLDARRHIVLLGKMQAGHDEDESNQNRCRCTQSAAHTLSGESYGDILAVHVVNEFRLHFDGGGQFAHLHSVQSEELGRCHTGFTGGEHQASPLVLRELADAAELGFALSQERFAQIGNIVAQEGLRHIFGETVQTLQQRFEAVVLRHLVGLEEHVFAGRQEGVVFTAVVRRQLLDCQRSECRDADAVLLHEEVFNMS